MLHISRKISFALLFPKEIGIVFVRSAWRADLGPNAQAYFSFQSLFACLLRHDERKSGDDDGKQYTVHELHPDEILTVILPEFVVAHWWEYPLHNQTALRLKAALLTRPGIASSRTFRSI